MLKGILLKINHDVLTNKTIHFNLLAGMVLLINLAGCVPRSVIDEKYVSDKIQKQSGYGLDTTLIATSIALPGVNIEDGLSGDEAVMLALWNSPQLKVDLADLGFARADLLEAGMLPNPVFSLLFPIGPKQMEFTLSYFVAELWQRPNRISMARLNLEKVAENLVLHGLAMIRDVEVSYSELNKSIQQVQIIEETYALSSEISSIAALRKDAGDISELEETAFRLEASQAKEAILIAEKNMEWQKISFLVQLGLISENTEFDLIPDHLPGIEIPDMETLINAALAYRPDMRAAELEIERAGEKMKWEKSKIIDLTAMLDANAQGKEGFEMGPGLALSVPLFNTNQGGRARAQTEMRRAANNYIVVQQTIIGELSKARYACIASGETYEMLSGDIVPATEMAVSRAEIAYQTGEISYLEYIDFRRQLLDARLRLSEAEAGLRINLANLYYSIGGKLTPL